MVYATKSIKSIAGIKPELFIVFPVLTKDLINVKTTSSLSELSSPKVSPLATVFGKSSPAGNQGQSRGHMVP